MQLQPIADSSSFWARILDFACNKSIFVQISNSGEILTTDLHILIHLPLKMKKRLPNSQSGLNYEKNINFLQKIYQAV